MKTIYVLLSRSGTVLSRLVRAATGDEYTHASIAFDEELSTLCSMARIHAAAPLPAALVRERPDAGYYGGHPNVACALVAVRVPDAGYALARGRLEAMLARQAQTGNRAYRYSLLGLLACRAGREWTRPGQYFCSQLVAQLLLCAGAELPKPPSLMRPQDLAAVPGAVCVWRGTMGALRGLTCAPAGSMMGGKTTAASTGRSTCSAKPIRSARSSPTNTSSSSLRSGEKSCSAATGSA